MFLIAMAIVAIGDAAQTVAASRLIWTDFGSFLDSIPLFDLTKIKFNFLIQLNSDFFDFIEYYLLPAPFVLVCGVFSILCYLASYRRKV